MDEYRPQRALTDEAVDRAVHELLDVEPSADFVARVRTRIERNPSPSVWFSTRWMAIATAAAFVLAIVLFRVSRPDQTLPPPELSVAQAPAIAATPRVEIPRDDVQTPAAALAPAAPSVEVLVSPAEAAGLRYLIAAVRDGQFESNAQPASGEQLEPPMPLVIEPLTVEPLASVADIDTGVLQ